jgi:hypothetical protein
MSESERVEPVVIHTPDGAELTITLLEAVDGVKTADGWEDQVPKGTRLVGVRLHVENTGTVRYDENITYGAILLDAHDQQYEPSTIRTHVPALGDMRLESGDRRAGMIAFELPESEEPAAVHLILDGGRGPDRGVWKFTD